MQALSERVLLVPLSWISAVPAPTAWLGGGDRETAGDQALVQLPSQNTAYAGWFALHELLGQLAYRWSR